jgi:hypothetical protein
MRSKLIGVGTFAFIIIFAVMCGLAIRQFGRAVRFDSNPARSQIPNAERAGEVNASSISKETIETGSLDLIGNTRVITTQGKTKHLAVDSLTAIYIQGETLYQTNQGDAALQACALERCPVYVVWSAQPDVASAIVIALSATRQALFPDPDPAGKTPLPLPSPTPPWIRLPSVVPATPLIERATPMPTRK